MEDFWSSIFLMYLFLRIIYPFNFFNSASYCER